MLGCNRCCGFSIPSWALRSASGPSGLHRSCSAAMPENPHNDRPTATAADALDLSVVALPFMLSLIAGSTDTIGFLSLNGLFTAHITGNLVVLAAHVVDGNPAILSYMLAVPVFMLVLLLTRLFASRLERTGAAPPRPLLLLELLLLIAFLVCCVAAPVHGPIRNRASRSSRVCPVLQP